MSTAKQGEKTNLFQVLWPLGLNGFVIKKIQIAAIRNQLDPVIGDAPFHDPLRNPRSEGNAKVRRTVGNKLQYGHQTQNQRIGNHAHCPRQFRP